MTAAHFIENDEVARRRQESVEKRENLGINRELELRARD
jgi:hypothetical protein